MEKPKKTIKIVHPTFILLPRKTMEDKKIYINKNVEKNLHYHQYSQCKKIAKENVRKYLSETGQLDIKLGICNTTFKYFKPTKRKSDKTNVSAIATKWFYDAIVELGIIEDDNDDFIKYEVLEPTEHDKDNPRIEITFTEI